MSDAICTATTNTDPRSIVTAYTQRLCKPWNVSDDALSFIAVIESGTLDGKNFLGHQVTHGFILTVYLDNRNLPTVGCGHLVVAGDKLKVGQTIAIEQAQQFLRDVLAKVESRLNNDVKVPLYQFEYDALVSIVFNCGAYTGADRIIEKINVGKYNDLFDFILPYRIGHNTNLKHRRFWEARLFASGVYDATH